jgi:Family of unknown function (DUF6446)
VNGKLVGGFLIAAALTAGAALYYLQVYHYYEDATAETPDIVLTRRAGGEPEPIAADTIRAIDATSSPIRFRACFTTPADLATLAESYRSYAAAEPLTAPGWFDCFDAAEIGQGLEEGRALAFLGEAGIARGVDRVVAVFADGRGFVWHQIAPDFAD